MPTDLTLLIVLLSALAAMFAGLAFWRAGRFQEITYEQISQLIHEEIERLKRSTDDTLAASFNCVSTQLGQVFESVGEMRALAPAVQDIRNVLSNAKACGTWGEISLGHLLEQVMAGNQYDKNVEVVPGSGRRVEYAIRLPGGEGSDGETVWLPLDAKFPVADYERLVDASECGEGIEAASSDLEACIRKAAKDISTKYVHPPHSTDFAVMFLPTEGLFAEVIRRRGLIDYLQHEYRIVVAGPTTLMALLSSLRMGFQTLAIQKKSSELAQLLRAIKTEFGKYSDVVNTLSKQLDTAAHLVEKLGVRTRAMNRKLLDVENPPDDDLSPHPARAGQEAEDQEEVPLVSVSSPRDLRSDSEGVSAPQGRL